MANNFSWLYNTNNPGTPEEPKRSPVVREQKTNWLTKMYNAAKANYKVNLNSGLFGAGGNRGMINPFGGNVPATFGLPPRSAGGGGSGAGGLDDLTTADLASAGTRGGPNWLYPDEVYTARNTPGLTMTNDEYLRRMNTWQRTMGPQFQTQDEWIRRNNTMSQMHPGYMYIPFGSGMAEIGSLQLPNMPDQTTGGGGGGGWGGGGGGGDGNLRWFENMARWGINEPKPAD